VVSDIPANTQLIDSGLHGMRVRLRDERSIADALLRLLGDERLRAAMGLAARERVLGNYSVDKVLDRYESLFKEALAGPQR
jgi:glycosyltransferase involved in cell wall biosynthesis